MPATSARATGRMPSSAASRRSTCSTTRRAGCARSADGASRPGRCRTPSSRPRRSRCLRDFSPPGASAAIPTLILPPQAGHHSCIVDYSERQSQVGVALAAGCDRLFVIEWLEATTATADCLDRRVRRLGARRDRAHRRAGAPDRRLPGRLAGGDRGGARPRVGRLAHHRRGADRLPRRRRARCSTASPWPPGWPGAPYRALVEAGGGVLRGEVMVAGFIALAPEEEGRKQLDLLLSIHDDEYVRRYADFEDWFKHTQDIAGRLLPLDRRAPVRGQRARRRHAPGRRSHRRPRPDPVPGQHPGGRARPHHAARAGLRARRPGGHGARPTCAASSSTAGTSGCSWAGPRCATTGRRCSPRSPDALAPPCPAVTTLAA